MTLDYKSKFNDWLEQEKFAVELLKAVGDLMYDKGIELVFFRNHLVDVNVSELMRLFDYSKNIPQT